MVMKIKIHLNILRELLVGIYLICLLPIFRGKDVIFERLTPTTSVCAGMKFRYEVIKYDRVLLINNTILNVLFLWSLICHCLGATWVSAGPNH